MGCPGISPAETTHSQNERLHGGPHRFSEAEKQSLRKAAEDFAKQHDLPTDDWTWLYGTCKGPHAAKSRGAWQAIAAALPHRKYKAVYSAGTRMLHEGNYKVPSVPDKALPACLPSMPAA